MTTHVCMLNANIKNEIKDKLYEALESECPDIELDEHIENGMAGRLCDLEDTINIYSIEDLHFKGGR